MIFTNITESLENQVTMLGWPVTITRDWSPVLPTCYSLYNQYKVLPCAVHATMKMQKAKSKTEFPLFFFLNPTRTSMHFMQCIFRCIHLFLQKCSFSDFFNLLLSLLAIAKTYEKWVSTLLFFCFNFFLAKLLWTIWW